MGAFFAYFRRTDHVLRALDQEPAQVRISGLGDGALALLGASGAFAAHPGISLLQAREAPRFEGAITIPAALAAEPEAA